MNLTRLSIENPLALWIVVALALAGGVFAYLTMPRFEDPEYTIRIAKVITSYPGADPLEVANEITEPLESAIQELGEVETLTSVSSDGLSDISVEIRYAVSKTRDELQIIWTKLRNKVADAARNLPAGASEPLVNDSFGDVFGLYWALTGEGYTPAELLDYAKSLRKSLLTVDGVAKVEIIGEQREAIYLEIARQRLASSGASINDVYETLEQENSVTAAGDIVIGQNRVAIDPTGGISSVEAIRSLVVQSGDTATRVRDVADVRRGYVEPPTLLIRQDGAPALGIGVAAVSGANIVAIGEAIDRTLAELEPERPLGMQLHEHYHQGKVVDASISGFAVNVVAALAIVVVTLLIFMGLRAGLVMGATVLSTIATTLLVMDLMAIPLHRISLGALVIALGMLVDAGVVITDGVLVGVKQGRDRIAVALEVTRTNAKSLLGGVLVGVIAFAPIGFAPGDTAEFTGDLFWVVAIALSLSWIYAVTFTPYLAQLLFASDGAKAGAAPKEGAFLRIYRGAIGGAIRLRWLTIGLALLVLASAIYGFGFVRSGFFPASTTPQVLVDYWRQQGVDIETTAADMDRLADFALSLDGVVSAQTLVGGNTLRYLLTYGVASGEPSYGQLLVKTRDYTQNDRIIEAIQAHLDADFPDGQGRAFKLIVGPGGGAKIEAKFQGPDPAVLRRLAAEAKAIMAADPGATMVRDDWRSEVPVVQPRFSETKGEQVGVSREDLAQAIETHFSGRQVGVFREGDLLIPIISRAPEAERSEAIDIASVQILSPATGRIVPALQVIDGASVIWRDAKLLREDRVFSIQAQADPRPGVFTDRLFERLRPSIEAIETPEGYSFAWEGEFGSSGEAQGNLATTFPMALLAAILVVVFLFNKIRQPLVVWAAAPLAVVGVAIGLLLTDLPLEFMAILGLLSLIGLLIQNLLVLVDATDQLIDEGRPRFDALIDAAASRLRPVMMGAVTTVLGVAPLYSDAFFQSMTVVIMFGLGFSSIITLFVTPALYAVLFGISARETAKDAQA